MKVLKLVQTVTSTGTLYRSKEGIDFLFLDKNLGFVKDNSRGSIVVLNNLHHSLRYFKELDFYTIMFSVILRDQSKNIMDCFLDIIENLDLYIKKYRSLFWKIGTVVFKEK